MTYDMAEAIAQRIYRSFGDDEFSLTEFRQKVSAEFDRLQILEHEPERRLGIANEVDKEMTRYSDSGVEFELRGYLKIDHERRVKQACAKWEHMEQHEEFLKGLADESISSN